MNTLETRRSFLQKISWAGLALPLGNLSEQVTILPQQTALSATPTQAQKDWMNLGFGMFVHFGINTYYDKEWSDGTLDPARYNPYDLDTDQWCRTAAKAGMKYIVFVCKHHDGFCNWPTKFTQYCIRNTPAKKDVLASVARSAERYGLKLGLYYSLWDRHEKTHDTDDFAYTEFVKKQLHELLTGYGPVVEIWFDGFWKKQKTGWTKPDGSRPTAQEFIQSWRMEGAYRWSMDHLYQFIKTIQPDTLVMNNATTGFPGVPLHPVDILSGEKATNVTRFEHEWTWLGKDIFLPMQIETTLSQSGKEQFKSGNWFWHPDDHSVASKEQILSWLNNARMIGANLLINCGPMANGKLRPEDEQVLCSLNPA